MSRQTTKITFALALSCLAATSSLASAAITTYNYPGASQTSISGYSDTLMAGFYTLPADVNAYPFLLQNGTYSTYTHPGASSVNIVAVTGSTFVGGFADAAGNHAFIANTSGGFFPLNVPGYTNTYASGFYGTTVTLFAWNQLFGWHTFTYNSGTYTELTLPGNDIYSVNGISADGSFYGYSDSRPMGFVYSNGNLRSIFIPNAMQVVVTGVSGDVVVGHFSSAGNPRQSFILRGDALSLFAVPGSSDETRINGITGNTIFGTYGNLSFSTAITIPEPASLSLLALAAAPLLLRRKLRP